MMSRPRILDAFCKAGGAGWGYRTAGFEVVGVDIAPQPNYPFEFHQGDALEFLREHGHEFDAIHASPPCQAYSAMKDMPDAREHPQLIAPLRELLTDIGRPYVIENVEGARQHMKNPTMLCGTMFDLGAEGFELRRHRLFESSVTIAQPRSCEHRAPVIGVYGGHVRCRSKRFWRDGGRDFPGRDRKALAMGSMGVAHKMTMDELSEAIPPAYTAWIGRQLLSAISPTHAAAREVQQ